MKTAVVYLLFLALLLLPLFGVTACVVDEQDDVAPEGPDWTCPAGYRLGSMDNGYPRCYPR